MNTYHKLAQYKKIDKHTAVTDADPHRLIQMLINGNLHFKPGVQLAIPHKMQMELHSIAQRLEHVMLGLIFV